MRKYRIRPYTAYTDIRYCIQVWRWWFPVWTCTNFSSYSLEEAKKALAIMQEWS